MVREGGGIGVLDNSWFKLVVRGLKLEEKTSRILDTFEGYKLLQCSPSRDEMSLKTNTSTNPLTQTCVTRRVAEL